MTDNQPAPSDGALIDHVRDALTSTADVPQAVYDAGYTAYTWRTVDAELAALMYDSASALADSGARSEQAATVRAMTFTSEGLTIEIEIRDTEILGQIQPGNIGEVHVDQQNRPRTTHPVDDVGGFLVSPVPTYPFRIVVPTASGLVVTGWVTIA